MDVVILAIFHIVLPLILLVAIRSLGPFPKRLAVFLFLSAPLAGAIAIALVRELALPKFNIARMMVTMMIFYPYGVLFFGLWVAAAGVIGWYCFRRKEFFIKIPLAERIWWGVGLGLLIGPVVTFFFWTMFSLDPYWITERISDIVSDRISLISLVAQGLTAGALCGAIIAWYLDIEHEPRSGRLTDV